MPNTKLSALVSLTGAGLASNDLHYVDDVSATTAGSKSITTAELLIGLAALPLAGGTMTGTITSTIGTVTVSTPVLSATQTWNDAAVTFKGFFVNITPSASASASRLFEMQLAGTSQFNVDRDGIAFARDMSFGPDNASGNGAIRLAGSSGLTRAGADHIIGWCSGNPFSVGSDVGLARNGSGVIEVNTGTVGTYAAHLAKEYRFAAPTSANGQYLSALSLTELTTIAAAATTDTTIQMPAGAIVLAVSVRVTTVIPTATSFSVGDSGLATRFSTANVGVAANSTDAGTKAGAYYNAGALSVRLTMNGGTPAANTGRVRVTIHYLLTTPPIS